MTRTETMARGYDDTPTRISGGRAFVGGTIAVILALFIFSTPMLFEGVDTDEIAVIQSPLTGELTVYTTPGYKWQGFGSVYTFKKRGTYEFPRGSVDPTTKVATGGIQIRFTDGGHATLYGSVQYELPLDDASMRLIVSNYRSDEAIKRNLIETAANKAIYLSGTLMTSKESYAEKRNDLFHYMADQLQNGIYQTKQTRIWVKDPITGTDKEVVTADIQHDSAGVPLRQEPSTLNKFGIKTFQFTTVDLPYDATVEAQIKQQQQLTMEVQTSIATKAKAEQEAQTAEAQGKAAATTARWTQEAIKAAAVVEADKLKEVAITNANQQKAVAETAGAARLNVAQFDRKAAEETKQKEILLGEGESKRKELILAADGALQQKLTTYENVMGKFAESFKGAQMTPMIVNGGGATGSASNTTTPLSLLEIVANRAALDLALDMKMQAQQKK